VARHFFWSLAGRPRRLAAALFFLFLAAASQASAQAISNCLQVICPPPFVTNYTCSDQPVAQPYPLILSNNCPGLQVNVNCQPPATTPFGPGAHAVDCIVTANGGVVAQCHFTVVVVIDTIPPVITCPTNFVVKTCPSPTGGCGAIVAYPPPVASDNSGSVAVTCVPPSGSFFPCGVNPVSCTAEDRCGNKRSCQFTITVNDQGQPPTITCPPDQLILTCSNAAVLSYPAPVALPAGTTVSCVPPPGTLLPVGASIAVTCTASNACGTAHCTFKVETRKVPPPRILCPTNDIIVTAPCGSSCVTVLYPDPTVFNGVLAGCQPPSGACLTVGLHFVICRATNLCGEVAGCEFPVRVIEGQGQGPVINCPPDLSFLTCSNCAVISYPAPTVNNGVLLNCVPPSGTCVPVGSSAVICIASNACGISQCTFKIDVRRVPPPVILCPSNDVVATVPCGSNCVPVTYLNPLVLNGTLVGCLPPSGSCLTVGTHFVICRATNVCGDVAGCEFPVRVLPGQGNGPVITCPTNLTVNTCSNCAVVQYPTPSVSGGFLVKCLPPPGTCFPMGQTVVTCTATNDCGRSDCEFVITVRPVPEVGIRCPSNIVVTTCANGVVVNYPSPTLTGTADPAGLAIICRPPSGSFFPVGTHRVTCCVVDLCQRTNCCEFLVTVLSGNPCVKPPLNMVLWLPFDEPAGIIAHNIVAGAPNGIHVNGPAPVLGQFVLNSLGFDGINDFVRVPNYAAIVLSSSDLSIDAWLLRRDTAQSRRVIVSKIGKVAGALGQRGYEYYLNNGIMNLFLGGPVAQNFSSGVAVPLDNAWHHVTVTVRRFGAAASVRFYLDGALVNTQVGPITAPIGNSAPLYVGAGSFPAPNSFFRGGIDEVEIFNRVLTPAEILSLWSAKTAGKCKIKCSIPWDVSFPPNAQCITIMASICNQSGVPQTVNWVAAGPMPFPIPNGGFVLPPFTCTNFPIQVCRPTNGLPVGTVVPWTLSVFTGPQCPQTCMGSVINPGPVIIVVPTDPVLIPGTNRTVRVRLTVDGLTPNMPGRIRVMGPDMGLDTQFVSLNGLPPGTPVRFGGGGGAGFSPAATDLPLSIRFADADPIGAYPVLVEVDLNNDGQFETLASFETENPVVPPPTLQILKGAPGYYLDWQDEGDGFGVLESSDTVDGTWSPITGAGPGYPLDLLGTQKYFRVAVPFIE